MLDAARVKHIIDCTGPEDLIVGGANGGWRLNEALVARDLGQELGVQMAVEDTWGGDIVSAASAHIAASTREALLLSVSFMNDWTNEHVAGYQPRSRDGVGTAPSGPGLGLVTDEGLLGDSLFGFGA